MINHVVLFQLKEYAPGEKEAVRNELKVLLESLKEKISEVCYLEVGANYQLDTAGYDLVLITHFESIESLVGHEQFHHSPNAVVIHVEQINIGIDRQKV